MTGVALRFPVRVQRRGPREPPFAGLTGLASALLVDGWRLPSQRGDKAVLVEKLRTISDARQALEQALSEVAAA